MSEAPPLGFSVSLSIEVVQAILSTSGFILRRSFDIDDLILNTSGFYAGYLIRALATMLISNTKVFKEG
ncbi:VanZ family protein [Paenibacillus sp. 2TAB19]|uniref:VanZ family protein n=1 Tax=Paenibacillus sp. 2TAB19 TaxID=3233003 RepID=UPI003F94EA19